MAERRRYWEHLRSFWRWLVGRLYKTRAGFPWCLSKRLALHLQAPLCVLRYGQSGHKHFSFACFLFHVYVNITLFVPKNFALLAQKLGFQFLLYVLLQIAEREGRFMEDLHMDRVLADSCNVCTYMWGSY